MSAFFGAIGMVGLIVGIVLIILGLIKKKKYRGGLIAVVSLVLFIVSVVATPSETTNSDNADETDTYKVEDGELTNNRLLINLAVRAESIIEEYDEIEDVTVDTEDIEAYKMSNQQDDSTEEVYENVYYIDGTYSWDKQRYDFEWTVSFEENDVETGGSILQYTSDIGANQLNVSRTAVED